MLVLRKRACTARSWTARITTDRESRRTFLQTLHLNPLTRWTRRGYLCRSDSLGGRCYSSLPFECERINSRLSNPLDQIWWWSRRVTLAYSTQGNGVRALWAHLAKSSLAYQTFRPSSAREVRKGGARSWTIRPSCIVAFAFEPYSLPSCSKWMENEFVGATSLATKYQ